MRTAEEREAQGLVEDKHLGSIQEKDRGEGETRVQKQMKTMWMYIHMQMWYMCVCVCSKLAKNYPTPLLHSLYLLFFLRSPHCPYSCDTPTCPPSMTVLVSSSLV